MPPHEDHAAERDRAVRERMNDPNATALEKALAALVGAAEGFAEEARKANLPALAGEAFEKAEATAREVRTAVRPPSLEGASVLPEGRATLAEEDYLGVVPPPGGAEVEVGLGATEETRVAALGERATAALAKAQHYAEAVAESGRRALEAPTAVRSHVKATMRDVGRDAARVGAGYGGAGVAAAYVLGFLSVALGIWLMPRVGPVLAWVVVGLAWLVIALVLFLVGRSGVEAAKRDARRGIEDVKAETRAVVAPLRGLRT